MRRRTSGELDTPVLPCGCFIIRVSAWRHPLGLPDEALSEPLMTHAWLLLPIRNIPDHFHLTGTMCPQVFWSAAP